MLRQVGMAAIKFLSSNVQDFIEVSAYRMLR